MEVSAALRAPLRLEREENPGSPRRRNAREGGLLRSLGLGGGGTSPRIRPRSESLKAQGYDRNQLHFKALVEKNDNRPVYSGGGTWHPEACGALGLEIHCARRTRRA